MTVLFANVHRLPNILLKGSDNISTITEHFKYHYCSSGRNGPRPPLHFRYLESLVDSVGKCKIAICLRSSFFEVAPGSFIWRKAVILFYWQVCIPSQVLYERQ